MKLNTFFLIIIFIKLVNSNEYIYGADNKNDIKVIDPFNYDSRENIIFKRIIDNTHLDVFGDDNMNNPFHGLQFLLIWQNQTGRLYTSKNDPIIKNYSWWGCMNYYFSVVPYLSANKFNLVPHLDFKFTFKNNSLFCSKYEECDKRMMKIWDDYFGTISKIKNNNETKSYSAEELLSKMWRGHQIGVEMGSKAFKQIHENSLSKPEMILSNGWLAFVEFLLTLNLNTNKTNIFSLQKSLPHRVLNDNDIYPPSIKDFTYDQKTFTSMIYTMHYISINKTIYNITLKFLQMVSSNENCRLLINNNINSFLNFPFSSILIVLIKIITNTC
ncbi:hypothetical protein DICPUDRAFT_82122 [Dictyostelium purpureum]|uniref:Phospholipase B-like n=1 Tax=Dictyostelium purpureum TaxID=5786 RepID=F0ZVK7_DICPU|nr:uncharacterized protein DICPUDRAFT_82122 [Dictyostelium purpureum]EGC32033.1 hypothetical protein DICPUDRAFT_82122 [Dictyostelium purpureum]|eukprot:XP_003291451.1 hypothetical protein DICPUDRAFT_82122 [Dictyostelium purpureum]